MKNEREQAENVLSERRRQFDRECETASRQRRALEESMRNRQRALDEQEQQLRGLQNDLQRGRR